jgi:hypothetical protein
MKSGVEASYLGYLGKVQAHRFNPGNLCRQMQGRERDQGSELLAERVGYTCWSRMIRATVYQAMTDSIGMRKL